MAEGAAGAILLAGFRDEDERAAARELARLGREARAGEPRGDALASFVLAAAYDEASLRGLRSAALDDGRPWAFCVPAGDRGLVAAASLAREGLLLLQPVEGRELKRLLSFLAEEAREREAGDAALGGLTRLDSSFSWRSDAMEAGRVARGLARLLSQAGLFAARAGEDECALALGEAIANALEHGNLELDSALRPDDMLSRDRYEEARASRLADPAYGGRRVTIGLELDEEGARISIEDEGAGFDPSLVDREPSGLGSSGKGFWLIRRPFDSAVYDMSGRKLTLSKRRPREKGLRP